MPARLTVDQMVMRIHAARGDRYTYDLTSFVNASSKIRIKCRKHGWFLCRYADHLAGRNCQSCVAEGPCKKPYTTERVLASLVIDERDDFSEALYVDAYTKLTIRCKLCGPYEMTAYNYRQGHRCPSCKAVEASVRAAVNPFAPLRKERIAGKTHTVQSRAEAIVIRDLTRKGLTVESGTRVGRYPYVVGGKQRMYVPDLKVRSPSGRVSFVEVKSGYTGGFKEDFVYRKPSEQVWAEIKAKARAMPDRVVLALVSETSIDYWFDWTHLSFKQAKAKWHSTNT